MDDHIRQLRFPQDFALLRDLFERGFTHPDHPEMHDEEEARALMDKIASARRLWPFFRPVMPALPRMFTALVWEEQGEPVGAVTATIRALGSMDYVISSAVVLPAYRGRGIALKLTAAIMQMLASWGAETLLATCISSNAPVLRIAQAQGGTIYEERHDTRLAAGTPFTLNAPLPPDATLSQPSGADWQALIAFAQRITPKGVQRFDPVRPADIRAGFLERTGLAITNRMSGYAAAYHVLWQGDAIRAYIYSNLPRRAQGSSRLVIRVEPAHEAALAPAVLNAAVGMAREANPQGDVTLVIPAWQPALLNAAREGGFAIKRDWTHLGYSYKGGA